MKEAMKYQREFMQKRRNNLTKHQKTIPKKPRQQDLRISKGVTTIPHNILEIMIADPDLTKRELKILLLIARLTFGLHTMTCQLRNRDFECTKLRETCTQLTIKSLVAKDWLVVTKTKAGLLRYGFSQTKYQSQYRDPNLTHLIAVKLHEEIWSK
jgi:hypothetical protein